LSKPMISNPLPNVSYSLPAFNSNMISGYFLVCRSQPFPNPRPYRITILNDAGIAAAATTTSRFQPPPFQTDPIERLVSFSFIFNVHHDDPTGQGGMIAWQESHVLFTHVSVLLSHLHPSCSSDPPPTTSTTIVPWDDWANSARWVKDRCRRNWYSHTYGHRFVKPTRRPAEDHRDAFAIRILDFNPLSVKKEAALQKAREEREEEEYCQGTLVPVPDSENPMDLAGEPVDEPIHSSTSPPPPTNHMVSGRTKLTGSIRLVTEPTIVHGLVFAEEVTTSLPYVEVTSTAEKTLFDFSGLMMCEEHVINLARRGNGVDLELDIFSV